MSLLLLVIPLLNFRYFPSLSLPSLDVILTQHLSFPSSFLPFLTFSLTLRLGSIYLHFPLLRSPSFPFSFTRVLTSVSFFFISSLFYFFSLLATLSLSLPTFLFFLDKLGKVSRENQRSYSKFIPEQFHPTGDAGPGETRRGINS